MKAAKEHVPGLVAMGRLNEISCRSKGLFAMAVQWQQYADALERRGECYSCELARLPLLTDYYGPGMP